jgi:hypothetical protein
MQFECTQIVSFLLLPESFECPKFLLDTPARKSY